VPLDPHAKRLLNMLAAGGGDASQPLEVARLRKSFADLADLMDDRGAVVGAVESFDIPTKAGSLTMRRYQPADLAPDAAPTPALLYLHGGAWVFCDLDTHDGLCRALCQNGNLQVFAAGYRQAPEHKFPAPMEDATASLAWLVAHAGEFGVDARRIAIGGDSAGATLAIGACLAALAAAQPVPALQLLLCPKTDVAGRAPSRAAFATGYFLEDATIAWAVAQLCPEGTDLSDWRLSPLRAPSLQGMPPTMIHTAEFDPLRDEGHAFADRLRDAGVPVEVTCHAGLIHHFYGLTRAIPKARDAVKTIGARLGERLRA